MNRRRLVDGILITAILLLACLSVYLWNQARRDTVPTKTASPSAGPTANVLPVRVVKVGSVPAPRSRKVFAGTLIPEKVSQLSFERAGRIASINVDEGDAVDAGVILAEIDKDDLKAAQLRLNAQLRQAEAVLLEANNGPRQQTIDAAAAVVKQLESDLALAQSRLRRQERLKLSNAGSRDELDAARFGSQSIAARLEAAKLNLSELNEGTREEQIAAFTAAHDTLKAQLAELDTQLADCELRSSYAGLIQSRMLDEGVVVSPGNVVLELISEQLEARFGIPLHTVDKYSVGMTVTVYLAGQSRTGVVDRIEPRVDLQTRTRAVFVRLDDASHQETAITPWVHGAVVSIDEPPTIKTPRNVSGNRANEIESGETDAADIWLPIDTLVRGGRGVWAVFVATGDGETAVLERRAVEVLGQVDEMVRVQGMMQVGERVASGGLNRLTAGMTVRVVKDDNTVGSQQ